MFSELCIAASLFAASSPTPATPDQFSDSLQTTVDVSADAVTAAADLAEGAHIDIAHEFADVGHARLAAHGELDGWATFILDLGGEWTELLEQSRRTFKTEHLATHEHEHAATLFNGLVQVGTTAEVEQALAEAAEVSLSRRVLCNVAGGLSGGAIGAGAGAGCYWFSKKLDTCRNVMFGVTTSVFGYIKDKCEGAQN